MASRSRRRRHEAGGAQGRRPVKRLDLASSEVRRQAAEEVKATALGWQHGKAEKGQGHRRLYFAVPRRRAGDSAKGANNDQQRCAPSEGDDQLPDARIQAAWNAGLLCCVGEAHRTLSANFWRQGAGESSRSLRRTEG